MIKDAKGYEEYLKVSEDGKVWRKGRDKIVRQEGKKPYKRHFPGGIIKPFDNGYGYLMVKFIYKGKSKNIKVHKLVAETFIPKHRNDVELEINHIDHNKYNNCVSNLEWVTRKENMEKMSDFYKEKNKDKKYKNKKYKKCPVCSDNVIEDNKSIKRCKKCFNKERREKLLNKLNEKGINKDSLYTLLLDKSFLEVGRMFNVSDNTVRKWCDMFEIPRKSSHYKNKNNR